MAAMVGAVTLGLVAVTGTAAASQAAPQDHGNIDETRSASLTVHKYLNQSGSAVGDISQAPAPGDFSDPVADVVFTAYPLLKNGAAVDLTNPDSWTGLESLTPGASCTAPAGYTLGSPVALPATGADGSASTALPQGLYQVCETSAPANIIEMSRPFILTLPMPHENGWVYDAHAFPKNGAGEIEKSVEPQEDLGLGSVMKFPVTVAVPRMADTWTGFAIRDTLDPRLEPVLASAVTVTLDGAPMNTAHYSVSNNGQVVTFELTAAGLLWLNEGPNNHVGEEIKVTFAGTITSLGNGGISNTAELWPNNPGFDPSVTPPLPSNTVETNWGDLDITKRAAGTSGAAGTLEGAVFEIYAADSPYSSDCSTTSATGAPIAINGTTRFQSNSAGVVSIAGLYVSDNVNPLINSPQRCYVLKEVAAPAGFVLPNDPFTTVAVKSGVVTSDNIEIENTQQGVPELPLTGAAGQLVLILGGSAALAVAVGLVLVRRNRANASN